VQLVGRIVFDAAERKCPAAGDRAQSATSAAPFAKMTFAAVVVHMAGSVNRGGFRTAFAFGDQVVLVKLSFGNRAIAEVADHIKRFSFVSDVVVQGTALRLENWQD